MGWPHIEDSEKHLKKNMKNTKELLHVSYDVARLKCYIALALRGELRRIIWSLVSKQERHWVVEGQGDIFSYCPLSFFLLPSLSF